MHISCVIRMSHPSPLLFSPRNILLHLMSLQVFKQEGLKFVPQLENGRISSRKEMNAKHESEALSILRLGRINEAVISIG